jgi:hypothetical protein
MFAGALAGALLHETSLFLPLAVATALAGFAWFAYPRAARAQA